MRVYAGRTFFLKSRGHLWIVLTEPFDDPQTIIIVNFTTNRAGADQTVVLETGDHPFISHSTVVSYADAKLIKVATLQALVSAGLSTFHSDCSEELLQLLREGLLRSSFTPLWLKERGRALF
ncbi:MAG: hypothetical protein ACREMA_00345 [Longimicrobiales bacterium]